MTRLDRQIQTQYPDFSRSRIEGLIKGGFVPVNGAVAEKAGMKVAEDDEIVVEIPPPVPAVPEPEDIPLDVVYEDADMLVVNKAPGMVVHPAPGHFTGTLVNALLHFCKSPLLLGILSRSLCLICHIYTIVSYYTLSWISVRYFDFRAAKVYLLFQMESVVWFI